MTSFAGCVPVRTALPMTAWQPSIVLARHPPPHVIVVGAGLSGLAAAWHLRGAGVEVTVVERDSRVGGRVHAQTLAGQSVELGADFFTNFYPNTLRLADAVGLTVTRRPIATRGAILRDGHLHAVSPPYRLLSNRLVPWRSNLRLIKPAWTILRHWPMLDHHAMWRADGLDTESVAEYARASLDAELLEYLLAPTLGGFLYWQPEETSKAMLFMMLKRAIGVRPLTVLDGRISALPEMIAARLKVRMNATVKEILRQGDGGYRVRLLEDGHEQLLDADGVICATTATQVPLIVPDLTEDHRTFFASVRYSTTVSVAVIARGRCLEPYNGVLLPRREADHLTAVTERMGGTSMGTPSPQHLLRLYASGAAAHSMRNANNETVILSLVADLRRAVPSVNAEFDTRDAILQRWPEALPIFDVGYLRRLRRYRQSCSESGVEFAGDYLGGPLIEGAVTSGLAAAARVITGMGQLRQSR
jgi:oxygen-dependent protoporphyrinogen oxidase